MIECCSFRSLGNAQKKVSVWCGALVKNQRSPEGARKNPRGPKGAASVPRGGKILEKCGKVCKIRVRPSKSVRRYAISAFHDAKVLEGIVFFEKQWKSAIRCAKQGPEGAGPQPGRLGKYRSLGVLPQRSTHSKCNKSRIAHRSAVTEVGT